MGVVTYATVNGALVEESRNGVVTTYVADTLGSVIQTRDAAGNQTSSTTYWPFGEVRTSTGTNPSPWGFCGTWGYFRDAASRMYVRARTYRADLSRWMTVDPLWPEEKAYEYAKCNPLALIDPTGLGQGFRPRKGKIFEACVAMICSGKEASDYTSLSKPVKALINWLVGKLLQSVKIDPGDCRECMKDANRGDPQTFIGRQVRTICSMVAGDKPLASHCAKHTSTDEECRSCCSKVFASDRLFRGKCMDHCNWKV